MAIPILRIYSTTMWKKYTTPISKEIATYAVGISEMAMPIYALILSLILLIRHVEMMWVYTSLMPLIVYILVLLFVFRVVGRLDRVLDYELCGNDEMAKECAQTIRRYINASTIVTVVITAIWMLACISFST